MAGVVRTVREGALGWVIFDHEERRNAINAAMWEAIPQAMADMVADPEVRVVLLRGAGEVAFVSGADISEFGTLRTGAAASSYDANNSKAFAAIGDCPKPVIAMIHGFCVGGGAANMLRPMVLLKPLPRSRARGPASHTVRAFFSGWGFLSPGASLRLL